MLDGNGCCGPYADGDDDTDEPSANWSWRRSPRRNPCRTRLVPASTHSPLGSHDRALAQPAWGRRCTVRTPSPAA